MGLKLRTLENLINKHAHSPGMREQMLNGARAGMLQKLKKLRKKGKEVTREALMADVNDKLLKLLGRMGISRGDLEVMANNILVDVKKGKL